MRTVEVVFGSRNMDERLIAQIEDEVLGWKGVTEGPGRFGSTVYRYGRREIGHVHNDGIADLPFPRKTHDELVSSGRASEHRAGSPGYVSYAIHGQEDVAEAIELFRMNYERAVESAASRQSA